MSESSEYRQTQTSATPEKAPEKAPEKTSNSSVEIARLMREGTTDSRKKAQELLQKAIAERARRAAENKD
ncbi:MAG: hypothetical protein ACYCQL_09365 [Acidithiobacillus sp.]